MRKLLYLFMLVLLATSALAATPNPGHDASRIGPGVFPIGDFAFNGSLTVQNTTNSTLFYINSSNGRIAINTTTPTYTLDVNGAVRVMNTLVLNASSGNLITGTDSGVQTIALNNDDITGVNSITIMDPGPSEGILWAGGNLWRIYESPNDLVTNGAGNLQVVRGTTGVATFDTNNIFHVNGTINISSASGRIYSPEICLNGDCQSAWPATGGASSGSGWSNTSLLVSLSTSTNNVSANTFFVDNTNGRIGVGTTTPSVLAHIVGTTEQLRLGYNTTSYTSFTVSSSGALTLQPTGDLQLYAASGSVVRAGTATADGGQLRVRSNSFDTAVLGDSGSSNDGYLALYANSSLNNVLIRANGTSFIAGGALGVNNTAPNATVHVTGTVNVTSTFFAGSTITGASGLTIQAGTVSLPTGQIQSTEIADSTILAVDLANSTSPSNGQVLAYNSTSGGFYWTTDQNGGSSSGGGWTNTSVQTSTTLNVSVDSGVLFVDSTNNRVGINDNSPSYALDVTGAAQVTSDITLGGNLTGLNSEFIEIGGTDGEIRFYSSGFTNDKHIRFDLDAATYPEVEGYNETGSAQLVSFPTGVYVSGSNLYVQNSALLRATVQNDGSTNGGVLYFNDAANVTGQLTAHSGFTVVTGTVSLPAGEIDSTEIASSAINATKLSQTNSASNGYYLTYDSATGGFTWVAPAGSSSTGSGWTNTSLVVSLTDSADNVSAGELFVDNTNDRVGIATTTPDSTFEVYTGAANAATGLIISQGGANSGRLFFSNETLGDSFTLLKAGSTFAIYSNGTPGSSSGTARFTVSDTGVVTATGGLTVSTGTVSLPSGQIQSSEIADSTIDEIDLNVSGTPAAGQLLAYNSTSGGFYWTTDQNGGSSSGGGWTNTSTDTSTSLNVNIDSGTFYVDSTNNRVGVGTTTPVDGALQVIGNVSVANGSLIATPGTPVVAGELTTSAFFDVIEAIAVQGKYAYVTAATNDTFSVVDISVPTAPVLLATLGGNGDANFNGASDVVVNGKYAYVASEVADRLVVVDISNPTAPAVAGSVTSAAQLDGIRNIYLQGKHIFATSRVDERITIVDVSNPTAPTIVGSSTADSAEVNDPWNIYVQGKYAYVSVRIGPDNSNTTGRMAIFDVSDPTNITKVSSFNSTTLNDSRAIYVSGRYAYVGGYASDSLAVIDVSNPASPVEVGSIVDATNLNGIYNIVVAGKYVYAAVNDGDRFTIIDVSNPAAPVVHKSITSGTQLDGAREVAITGRYAYVAAAADDELVVVDLGSEVPTLFAGALGASTLYVEDNADFGNDVRIAGGVNVGGNLVTRNGITTYYDSAAGTSGNEYGVNVVVKDTGPVAAGTDNTYGLYSNVTRTGPTAGTVNTYGGYFLVGGDTGGTSTATGLYASAAGADANYAAILNGYVGINNTSPTSTLHVTGTATISSTLTASSGFTVSAGSVDFPANSIPGDDLADGSVDASELEDAGIMEADLNASNAPTDNYVLTYNSATGGFTWDVDQTGVGSSTAAGWTNTSILVSLSDSNDNVSANTLFVDNTNARVGIGSAAPTYKLDVNSASANQTLARFSCASGGFCQIIASDGTRTADFGVSDTSVYMGANSNHLLQLRTGATTRVTIDTAGGVGINDTSPSYTLDVTGTAQLTGDLRLASAVGSYGGGRVQAYSGGDIIGFTMNSSSRTWDLISIVSSNPDYFGIRDSTAGANRLTIDESGNVDIVGGALEVGGTSVVDSSRNVVATTINTGSGAMDLGDAAVANGDTNSVPTSDQVYDFVIAQSYITDDTNVSKNHLNNAGTLGFDWADSEIADALTVSGGTIGSNSISSGSTLTTLGTWTLGDNGDNILVSANNWDVTGTGAATFNNTVTINGQDTTNEGGEVVLRGAGSYNQWNIDNYQGRIRFFNSSTVYLDFNQTRLDLQNGATLYVGGTQVIDSSRNIVNAGTGAFSGALTSTTLDTGQGANELYDMDQNVLTTSAVTFATINTAGTAMELGDAAVANGDTNSIPTSDQVYDFVTGQGYFTTSNDGSGSGLDADLLDNTDSASFFILNQNEAVTGIPAFNGGTSGATAPFTVDSTFVVTNLNADLLDGQSGAFYMPASTDNWVNTGGDTMTGPLVMSSTYIDINRQGAADTGINWYSSTYDTWATYMSPTGAGMGPKGTLTAPSGSLVTSWALRNYIEDAAGYGWTWESGTGSGDTTPAVKFEIRSSDGSFHSYGAGTVDGALTIGGVFSKSGSYKVGDGAWGANRFEVHTSAWDGSSNGDYGGISAGHGYYYGGLQSGGATGSEAGSGQLYVSSTSMLMGSVGIGDATPDATLDVAGTGLFDGDVTVSGGRITLTNGFIADDASVSYTRIDPQADLLILYDGGNQQSFQVYHDGNHAIQLTGSNTESSLTTVGAGNDLRIQASGGDVIVVVG